MQNLQTQVLVFESGSAMKLAGKIHLTAAFTSFQDLSIKLKQPSRAVLYVGGIIVGGLLLFLILLMLINVKQ